MAPNISWTVAAIFTKHPMGNKLFSEITSLATEQRNPASMRLDMLDTESILRLINAEDEKVAKAVEQEIPHITKVVDQLVASLQSGGRLIYAGAGTSGRMGVVDAAECPPTFGSDPTQIVAIIAGGPDAVFRAKEGAEDIPEDGGSEMDRLEVSNKDVVIGIAASKRTPFVLGVLERAHEKGAFAVLLTTNPRSEINFPFLSHAICPEVGPEVLMGSTRMKSAVAQKMVLTMITTTAMVRLGKVYENMMVDLQLTNQKLVERAKRIIMMATSCDLTRATTLLQEAGGHVKSAIVMQKLGVDRNEAGILLANAGGFVRQAIIPDRKT